MRELKPGSVYIEISRSQSGGLSLCVSNDSGGYRIAGDKVGGCETVKTFEVDAKELIREIRAHMRKVRKQVVQHD